MGKALVSDVDLDTSAFTVEIDGAEVVAYVSASTTLFLGTGDPAPLASLKAGQNIYLFGKYDPVTRSITADKVVIRNKRITERTALSRAELKKDKDELSLSPLYMLGLTAR
jgi:hypothetical protein